MTAKVMRKLYPLCEKSSWRITVALAWKETGWMAVDLEAGDTSRAHYGLAVDLGSGINRFGTPAHTWMRENAPRYGWVHPSWARQSGSLPEAWHWEFAGQTSK